ncbi:MAG: LysR family transcriptional regulator [Pseudomonadota bacterium]
MTRTLDLTALRSFVAIAQTGGVTKAAQRLNLTQSAVSMQLKRLETALGQPLFERERKAMILTASGEQVLSYASRMLDMNDELWARMTGASYEGELTLGAPHDVVYPHIPEVLRRFERAFPRVRISLHSSYTPELKEQLDRGEVDVILTTETEPEARAEVLQESPLVWIGAPGGSAWRQRPLPLAFETGCIFRPWVQSRLDAAGIPWTMAVDSLSIRTVDACISADFAVHAAISFTVQRRYEVIDHHGALPDLPTTKVAQYVTEGPNRALAQELASLVRETWAQGVDLSDPLAIAAE